MTLRAIVTALVACAACAGNAFADVKLPGIISDHMLLQRGVPARIFGTAEPGESVTVLFRGQTAATTADAIGRWEVWLQPLAPGPAAEMTIRGTNRIRTPAISATIGVIWAMVICMDVASSQRLAAPANRRRDHAPASRQMLTARLSAGTIGVPSRFSSIEPNAKERGI